VVPADPLTKPDPLLRPAPLDTIDKEPPRGPE
jgi:hypothetical protein